MNKQRRNPRVFHVTMVAEGKWKCFLPPPPDRNLDSPASGSGSFLQVAAVPAVTGSVSLFSPANKVGFVANQRRQHFVCLLTLETNQGQLIHPVWRGQRTAKLSESRLPLAQANVNVKVYDQRESRKRMTHLEVPYATSSPTPLSYRVESSFNLLLQSHLSSVGKLLIQSQRPGRGLLGIIISFSTGIEVGKTENQVFFFFQAIQACRLVKTRGLDIGCDQG